MKPTNKTLLSLPVRQVSSIALVTPSSGTAESKAIESAVTGHVALSVAQQSTEPLAPQLAALSLEPSLPAARASTTLVGALICTSLALVASLAFIARSHLAAIPLAANGLQPLVEIDVADIDQPEPRYAMELAFPPRETVLPQPVVARRAQPAKLKIGVYKQPHNVEKWRRWARQQNVTFEAVRKSRDGEPHYVLYLCEQDPARIDQLKLDVARISGETPLLVRRASRASI